MQSQQPIKERERLGREKLQRIIDTCKSFEGRSLDPFIVDINEQLKTVKENFSMWKIPEDLVLDAETVHCLASMIKLQGDWVKHRSTSLYTDPFLLEAKLRTMTTEQIVSTFMKAWHPVVEFEQISLQSLAEALRYWEELLPLNERWKEELPQALEAGFATREELVREKILRDKAFSEELEGFWQELKRRTSEKGEAGKIRYWDFVGAETFEETVQRAFMTSFLVTYGYATLEIHPLEEETFLVPYEKQVVSKASKKQLVSIPIAVSRDEWLRWKRGEQD